MFVEQLLRLKPKQLIQRYQKKSQSNSLSHPFGEAAENAPKSVEAHTAWKDFDICCEEKRKLKKCIKLVWWSQTV